MDNLTLAMHYGEMDYAHNCPIEDNPFVGDEGIWWLMGWQLAQWAGH